VYFALCGLAPFGETEPQLILARQLAGGADLSHFAPSIAGWMRKGFAPSPDDRFHDAAEMKQAWRDAVRAARRRERNAWWRRNAAGKR
jgi:hypothetical protein